MAGGAAWVARDGRARAKLACAALLAVVAWPLGDARAADPVIATAGDIACSSSSSNYNGGAGTADKCRQRYTSDLLVNAGLAAVLPLGDTQYESASLSGLNKSYHPSWGRVKSITRPAPGNHEYKTAGAAGYYDYFNGVGQASGPAGDRTKGYYSFNVGTWHLIALNSTDHCTIVPCGVGSAQETWLKADLAANADKYCTLAYWHDPRFNSGHDGNADEMAPLYQALYNADADVVLGGHAHDYERFAPQNPSGALDNTRGIRQFVVGTGGAFFTSVSTPKPNSQVRQNNTYGVLKLTLRPSGYDWQFVSESNKPFTDAGSGNCHGGTPPPSGSDTQKPTVPGSLSATAGVGQVALNWNASNDNVGVTGYRIYRGTTQIGTVGTTTSYTDTSVAANTTYTYTVRAEDAAGNLSDPSNAANATTPASTILTLPAEADARVQESAATTNYGTSTLRTDGGTNLDTDSFLRFNVSGVTGTVASAKLRIFAYTSTVDGPAVYATSPAWNESAINWSNRPARTSGAVDDKGAITTNTWVEYDVTQFVTGNGTVGLSLATTSSDGVDFRSREHTTATQRPELVVTTSGPDTQKPTTPGGLTAVAGTGQVALNWNASTDNVGVTGYRVFRGAAQVATLGNVTSYTDTSLAAGPYSYTVRAADAAGNLSDASAAATATVPDTTKPGPPVSLGATGSAGQVALSWGAASDNVGVTGYRVFRGTQQIASLGNVTSYTDAALAPGPYTYTVRAVDAAANVSDESNSATGTVPDTTKPSAPPNLDATASAGQIALSWGAASDNVGVTGYRVFRGPQQIATLGNVTSYTDSGLAAGPHSYTVRAVDAAANVSDESNSATGTVPDTTKPSAPLNLDATASAGQVALSWSAADDDVGVTGYQVFRGTQQIATLGNVTSYTDSGLAAGPHSYTVRAVDAAANVSDASNTATATVPDTTKPTAPANLSAVADGPVQADLAWDESTDDVAVTDYEIYRDDALIATVPGTATSYSDTVLPGTYSYQVHALDAAGNRSDPSNTATATPTPPDLEAPAAPSNLAAVVTSAGDVDLTWQESQDNVAVTGYRIDRDGDPLETVAAVTAWSDTTVAPGDHTYVVHALDAGENISQPSNEAAATVPDLTAPTAPRSLAATGGPGQVELSWDASDDDVAVTRYRVLRAGTEIADLGAAARNYTDDRLAPGDYSYTVHALDAAANESEPGSVEATVPDTTDPSAPGNLTATVNGDQVDLQWDASGDDVAVTGYRVLRGDTEIASLDETATTYADTALAPDDYSYTVRAVDAAGNESEPSDSATATVPDTEPPDAPAGLTATASGSAQVDLAWSAASDNVAVTAYEIYRDGAAIATIDPATSHSDTVVPGTYAYELRAVDAAGNASDPSNEATVTVYPPDDEPPTAPANLAATATAGQIDVTWEAATDNRGVTGYEVRRNGTLIDTLVAVTSYLDTNVAATVPYTYEVRAVDGAGNVSDPSNTDEATVPDTQKPTAPANLVASASASQVDLTWEAAGDDVAVTDYTIYRDGAAITTVGATTSYSDTSVSASGYDYVVRAVDAAGNLSDASNTATAVVPDAQKPTAPGSLAATPAGPARVDLAWQAATDNIGVTGYVVYRNSLAIATLETVTAYADTGVAGSTTYAYEVRAVDAAGNASDPSNEATATTPAASALFTFAPDADARVQASAPTTNYATSSLRTDGANNPAVESFLRFTVTGAPAGSVRSAKLRVRAYTGTVDGPAVYATNPAWTETAINWNNRPPRTSTAHDDKGAIAANTWVEYDVTPLVSGDGSYSFNLVGASSDGVDFRSRETLAERPELVVTTGAPDSQQPTPPTNLGATVRSASQVDLAWQAAGDNVGVTGYRVFRNGTAIATLGVTTAYSDTGASPATHYSYEVRALDAAGNVSDPSNVATADTPGLGAVMTISPEADARVHEASPSTNYGTAYLRANGGSELDVETFLRFAVSGVPAGGVQSAKLRLYAYNGTVDGPAVYTTGTAWSETAVTWSTRPARTSAAADDKGAVPVNTWVEYDVTPFVTGSGSYSFTIATTSNDGIDFYNREAATLRPELVVTLKP